MSTIVNVDGSGGQDHPRGCGDRDQAGPKGPLDGSRGDAHRDERDDGPSVPDRDDGADRRPSVPLNCSTWLSPRLRDRAEGNSRSLSLVPPADRGIRDSGSEMPHPCPPSLWFMINKATAKCPTR
jgi:hypothetical protein